MKFEDQVRASHNPEIATKDLFEYLDRLHFDPYSGVFSLVDLDLPRELQDRLCNYWAAFHNEIVIKELKEKFPNETHP